MGSGLEIKGRLESPLVDLLKSWRSSRYLRYAWPDAFIRRLDKGKGKIDDQLVKGAPLVHSLILRLNSYEELESEDYLVDLALIFLELTFSKYE